MRLRLRGYLDGNSKCIPKSVPKLRDSQTSSSIRAARTNVRHFGLGFGIAFGINFFYSNKQLDLHFGMDFGINFFVLSN